MLTKNNIIKDLKNILPRENVLSELEERYAYSQDATNIPSIKNLADAVVFVQSIEEVQDAKTCSSTLSPRPTC